MNSAVIDEYIKMTCVWNAIKPGKPAAVHGYVSPAAALAGTINSSDTISKVSSITQ